MSTEELRLEVKNSILETLDGDPDFEGVKVVDLSLIHKAGNEYVGIIQNMDSNLASMYNFENIKDNTHKREFLEIGEEWWWGTNRMIPINIIFKTNFEIAINAPVLPAETRP